MERSSGVDQVLSRRSRVGSSSVQDFYRVHGDESAVLPKTKEQFLQIVEDGFVWAATDEDEDQLVGLLEPKALYRKEAADWVQPVKSRAKTLETIVEQVAGILLKSTLATSTPKRAASGEGKGS